MTDPGFRFDQLIAALKESDFRLTPQRVELVRLIAVSEGHPSANQFYEQIKQKFPTISRATVYKTLALLKELNQVLEIDLREDSHYDGNRPQPHPHLICVKCNRIADGDLPLDQESIQRLEKVSGYIILRPQISFYGLCPDCKEER
ncbi:MAG: transcriptional repressor [Anaerolineae bacterium]|nr:transcriptional repressor [Anaerolineae bacterium]